MDLKKYQIDICLFDFDGTLLNSEPYHKKSHNLVLNEILGRKIDFSDAMFSEYIGKTDDVIFDMYKKNFNVEFDKEKMIAKKISYATKLLKNKKVKIFDYFYQLYKEKGNKKFYILTNQNYDLLMQVLKEKGIDNCFDGIFSLSKMKVHKRDFIENLDRYIDIKDKKVALFEDLNINLILAKQNNIIAVGVENTMNKGSLPDAEILIDTTK